MPVSYTMIFSRIPYNQPWVPSTCPLPSSASTAPRAAVSLLILIPVASLFLLQPHQPKFVSSSASVPEVCGTRRRLVVLVSCAPRELFGCCASR